ncbi:ring canal kelch homolog isoform X2 [Acyrthosiphon pisum]|uniref:BACK domain-containing protein n=1 Tax=Acyrthosiphon pisum TaxID=7029 RepID=A0A8R2JW16_ACYPI|nr:ring canal kelch homolog isoform X2 [Acyrthosiphon pisum]|eukprot:XP_016656717.1 PREDICTED: ring canal kelch homolog isoform X2 [Acyrthosiphon pisum]
MQLSTSSELYIQQHFSDVVEGEEFLSMSYDQMVKLISSEELTAPSEEKIFESVIRWVKHDLGSRKQILPQLIEHVRLPLTSRDYILEKVLDEPVFNSCLECKDYVIEALHFHLLKSDGLITIPHNIRTKPRQPGGTHKVILVVGGLGHGNAILDSTEFYDPKLNQWKSGPKMITPLYYGGLAVLKDNNIMLYVGGHKYPSTTCKSVFVLDLSSELTSWKPTVDMLVKRQHLGIGVINNYVFAVGGYDGECFLNSAEVFDCRNRKWRLISNMSTKRSGVGLGVLNNLLYAVGGFDGISQQRLKSVECYNPSLDKWTTVAEMFIGRSALVVGILDGVLYAVGGHDGFHVHRTVEAYRPSTGVWTTVADMHLCRRDAGVAVLDGLLYVVGGSDGRCVLDSIECYNPNTNTWTMVTASMNVPRNYLGVVVIDSLNFKTC